jgi:threonine dehydratase
MAAGKLGRSSDPFDFDREELDEAAKIVRAVLPPTPQIRWPLLARRTGADVWVKHENHLPTGAFKVRGGIILVDALMRGHLGPPPQGTITASVGNHGLSQTFAGTRAGLKVTVVVPVGNNPEKNAALRAEGAELVEEGHDYSASYEVSVRLAQERGLYLVEPFLPELVRGVATYALELMSVVRDLDTIYVPVGMGSGICGLIKTRDLLNLRTDIVGVVSTHAPAHALSFEFGRLITTDTARTFADGVAVRVPKQEAIEIIRRGAARIVQVTDAEVADAIRCYHDDTHNMVEGAAATPLAALLQERDRQRGRCVALIMTGANIARPQLARILAGERP